MRPVESGKEKTFLIIISRNFPFFFFFFKKKWQMDMSPDVRSCLGFFKSFIFFKSILQRKMVIK